jgi:hypothetical protein
MAQHPDDIDPSYDAQTADAYDSSDRKSQFLSKSIVAPFAIDLILCKLDNITHLLKEIHQMSTTSQQALADLQQAATNIGTQQTAMAASLTDLQNAANNIANAIAALQALVASGGVAPADVENVVASLNAAATSLGATQTGVEAVVTAENTEASGIGGASGVGQAKPAAIPAAGTVK